jgi:hypothetical protein
MAMHTIERLQNGRYLVDGFAGLQRQSYPTYALALAEANDRVRTNGGTIFRRN